MGEEHGTVFISIYIYKCSSWYFIPVRLGFLGPSFPKALGTELLCSVASLQPPFVHLSVIWGLDMELFAGGHSFNQFMFLCIA